MCLQVEIFQATLCDEFMGLELPISQKFTLCDKSRDHQLQTFQQVT